MFFEISRNVKFTTLFLNFNFTIKTVLGPVIKIFYFCSRGQLGHGLLDDESEPLLIEALAGINIVKVSAGGWHSCALSADGDLYTWGWNSNGQLGMSSSTEKQVTVQATPHLIDNIGEDLNISMVAAGNRHTIVLTGNFFFYLWHIVQHLIVYIYKVCVCRLFSYEKFLTFKLKYLQKTNTFMVADGINICN